VVEEAQGWLQYAVETQHPEYAPVAAADLASTLAEHRGQQAEWHRRRPWLHVFVRPKAK
jgi:hypothetical protein